MSQWTFVAAAYAVTLGGAAMLVLASWRAMRAAEGEQGREQKHGGRP